MITKELVYKEFARREAEEIRAPYNPELEFYSEIRLGHVERVKELCSEAFADKEGLGKLSRNSLQNIKYHFVITVAMVARYCIDGGMEVATAYSLSDYYIMKADEATKVEQINRLHNMAVTDYAGRMRNIRKKKISSLAVVKAIDYINDNLHKKITVSMLAEHSGISESHMIRLFKQETGKTIGAYVLDTKLEVAKNMLTYSEYTPAEISAILAFADQSYFTEVFRKKVGIPPVKYRAQHLMELGM